MGTLNFSDVEDYSQFLEIGKLYILSSDLSLLPDSNKIIFHENFPPKCKLLGKVYYFSLGLWDEVNLQEQTIKRNCDLSLNEPFTVLSVKNNNFYYILQIIEDGPKMGYIKIIGNTKSSNLYTAFLVCGS